MPWNTETCFLSHTQIHHHGHTQLPEQMCIHRRLNISMMPAHRYVCLYTHTHMRVIEKHRKHAHIQTQVCKPGQLLRCATYVVTQGITVRGAPT